MKKKIVIGIVVFFMLVLLIPIRMQMKDGGSVQYKAVLYTVTKYHQITMEMDDENEEVADSGYRVGWGVKVLGLEIFNNVKYVSDTKSNNSAQDKQSDFLMRLPEDYTLEDARIDGCVCFDNGDITEGQNIWDDFVDATNTQEEATVRLAFYYSLDEEQCDPEYYESVKDEYPMLYIQELTYKDDSYTIRWFEEGEEIKKTYKYLMKYEGEPESETALYESYMRYVLTNDNTVTWEQIWRGLASSKLDDAIDHQVVYQKYHYNEWGITLTAENVTPTSVTIKCTQSGGEPTGKLQTGSRYVLEMWTQEYGWQAVPCYAEIYWTEEVWLISKDRVTEWEVKWERFYGKLSEGKYRIGKEIIDVRDTGDYDTEIYYVEFEIVE